MRVISRLPARIPRLLSRLALSRQPGLAPHKGNQARGCFPHTHEAPKPLHSWAVWCLPLHACVDTYVREHASFATVTTTRRAFLPVRGVLLSRAASALPLAEAWLAMCSRHKALQSWNSLKALRQTAPLATGMACVCSAGVSGSRAPDPGGGRLG